MANIFDQYAQSQAGTSLNPFDDELQNPNEQLIHQLQQNVQITVEEPIFTRLKIDFKPIYPVTNMVASNNQLLIALENRQILKIDQMNPKVPIEIDLNAHITDKSKHSVIHEIFIDPTGKHCLFSLCLKLDPEQVVNPKLRIPFENFYYGKRVTALSKFKGHLITAVGWNTLNLPDPNSSNTGSVLIGTAKGKIFETYFNSDDRFLGSKEAFVRQVCELPVKDSNSISEIFEPICAINIVKLRNHSKLSSASNPTYCILVATSNFLYYFIGDSQSGGSSGYLKDIASTSASASLYRIFENPLDKMHKEIVCSLNYSKLDLYYPPVMPQNSAISIFPKSFGWLTKPGIFFNTIEHDLSSKTASKLFQDAEMILFNNLADSGLVSPNEMPLSIVSTEFHILLLYPTAMRAVCVLNKEVVYEDPFSVAYGNVLGICRDPIRGTIWVYTQHAVYRYKIVKEDRNIWEIHLKNKNFKAAIEFARDDKAKLDKTKYEQALHCFETGSYTESARLFAAVDSKTFEEMALKFIELRDNNQEALKLYLLEKLKTLSPLKDRTRVIMLLLWIIEINLNQLGQLKNHMEDCDLKKEDILKIRVEYNSIEERLKTLICDSNYRACFKQNKQTIYNLLMTHTNQAILIYFAEQIDDFERLIEHHLQAYDYDRALNILRKEECLLLYYRYSPLIVQEKPAVLVSQLLPLAKSTDFNKLIPALVHFDNNSDNSEKNRLKREEQCNEILRYLEFCAFNLKTSNSLVHNYLIALYAQYQPDKLLTYLQSRDNNYDLKDNVVPYDVRYAARLCTQLGLSSATVHLLATMGAVEEAVEQALANNDVELAKTTVKNIFSDQKPELAKKLWMKIAKFIIKKSQENSSRDGSFNAKMATEILNESNSQLKIEDILPYFPEFTTIDHFKDAIRESLEEYNENIESLRQDMKTATESAQEIRDKIKMFRDRFTVVSSSDRCSLCDYFILTKPFYAFNCRHLFHTDCLTSEVVPLLQQDVRHHYNELVDKLASLNRKANNQNQTIDDANQRESLSESIQDIIAPECYFCGDLMISSIDKIIDREEYSSLKGWD